MKHAFHGSLGNDTICAVCGYESISHSDEATCEACGLQSNCEFYPDEKHSRKMLLCSTCYTREQKAMQVVTGKTNPIEQVNAISTYQIKTAGDYFNANIPAIMDLKKAIEADESIEPGKKKYEEAKQVKLRLEHLSKSLFEVDKTRASLANEQRETLVYFNHLMKDLSADKQHELGLKDITYKQERAPKKVAVPSVKKFDKNELRQASAEHNIPEYVLQGIVTARKVSVTEAVKVYNEVMKTTK